MSYQSFAYIILTLTLSVLSFIGHKRVSKNNKTKLDQSVMVLMCLTCATLSGLNQTCWKVFDLAIAGQKNVVAALSSVLAVAGSYTLLYLLNLAMKMFKQIEVIPCY
jgi:hypothetical protein